MYKVLKVCIRRKANAPMKSQSSGVVLIMILFLTACSSVVRSTVTPEPTVPLPPIVPEIFEDELFRTFVIVPDKSKASYTVTEEFFAGALRPLGIDPGFNTAFGWTRNIRG